MNKTIKTWVALLPLFITSCYNDDTTVTTNPQQDRVVAVNAGITREGNSTTGSAFANNDKILITNVTRKNAGLICNSAVFTCNGSSWTSEGTLLWSAGEENTFQAVYPSTASYSSFIVPSDQSTEENFKSADWMTCEKKVTLNNLTDASPLNLEFKRKMAMVVVQITGEIDVTTLSSLKVESPSPDNNNNITFETQDHKITAYKDANTGNMFSAIIAPGSKSSEALLCTLKLSDSTEKSLYLGNDIEFQAGCKYTFACNMPQPSNNASTRSASPDNLTLVSVEPM